MNKLIRFTYNNLIDKEIWQRYNSFINLNKSIWGRKIPNIKNIISINQINFDVDSEEIETAYNKIFKIQAFKIEGYIVTTPFSMINDGGIFDKKKGIIYYSIYNLFGYPPSVVIAHEIFHIYFEKYTERKIDNYNESKEYFTVILNDVFKNDVSKGYPEHHEVRSKILKEWQKTHSIDQCIRIVDKKYKNFNEFN